MVIPERAVAVGMLYGQSETVAILPFPGDGELLVLLRHSGSERVLQLGCSIKFSISIPKTLVHRSRIASSHFRGKVDELCDLASGR